MPDGQLTSEQRAILEEFERRAAANPALRDALRQAQPQREAVEQPVAEAEDTGLSPARVAQTGRTGATMVGGMGGAAIGAPLGPVGAVVGGGLGAMIGSLSARQAEKGARAAGFATEEQLPPRTSRENIQETLRVGGEEALLGGAAAGLPVLFNWGRRAAARGFGATQEGIDLAKRAESMGIQLDALDVASDKSLMKGLIGRVLGRFPFLGPGPIKAAERKIPQIKAFRDRTLYRWGPVMNQVDVGVNMNDSAKLQFKLFRNEANAMYNSALNAARSVGATVDVSNVKMAAQNVIDALTKKAARTVEGATPREATTLRADLLDFMEDTVNLQRNATVDQLDDWLGRLDGWMTRARNEGLSLTLLSNLKGVAEKSVLENISHPEIGRQFKAADRFFADAMNTVFKTPTAQRFNRVTKARFRVGLETPGTLNPDEVFRVAWNAKSASAMSDLRTLVGQDSFRMGLGAHLDQAFNRAFTETQGATFSVEAYRKFLGLDHVKSAEYKAMQEALRGTGLTMGKLKDFGDILQKVNASMPEDVNAMIARRAVLGGWQSMVRTFVPMGVAAGGGATAGPLGSISAVGGLMLIRGISRLSTNPKLLKQMDVALDQDVPKLQRRMALLRVAVGLDRMDEGTRRDLAVGKAGQAAEEMGASLAF